MVLVRDCLVFVSLRMGGIMHGGECMMSVLDFFFFFFFEVIEVI